LYIVIIELIVNPSQFDLLREIYDVSSALCSYIFNGNILQRLWSYFLFCLFKIFLVVLQLTSGNFSPKISLKSLLLGCISTDVFLNSCFKLLSEYLAESWIVTLQWWGQQFINSFRKEQGYRWQGLCLNPPYTFQL
jgi:hypothetical protein